MLTPIVCKRICYLPHYCTCGTWCSVPHRSCEVERITKIHMDIHLTKQLLIKISLHPLHLFQLHYRQRIISRIQQVKSSLLVAILFTFSIQIQLNVLSSWSPLQALKLRGDKWSMKGTGLFQCIDSTSVTYVKFQCHKTLADLELWLEATCRYYDSWTKD